MLLSIHHATAQRELLEQGPVCHQVQHRDKGDDDCDTEPSRVPALVVFVVVVVVARRGGGGWVAVVVTMGTVMAASTIVATAASGASITTMAAAATVEVSHHGDILSIKYGRGGVIL